MDLLTRDQQDSQYQWDLTSFYESDEAFDAQLAQVSEQIKEIPPLEAVMTQSGETFYNSVETILGIGRQVSNLRVYAHLKNDQDQTNGFYQAMDAKAQQLSAQYQQAASFLLPTIATLDAETLSQFQKSTPALAKYDHFLANILRERAHILPADQEALLAEAIEIFNGPTKTFSLLNNADIEFPMVTNDQGEEQRLTHGNYTLFLESVNRSVRKHAFEAMYQVYAQFKNTLASTLATKMKVDNVDAKVHHYSSARASALSGNNIPEAVYDTLLDSVGQHLEHLHRYTALRKELLNLDALEMYDMYTPLLGDAEFSFTYPEAQAIVLKALAPLGDDYLAIIKKAFDERWIDVYENVGKRSGAYSSGSYDSNPYILMNWQDNLNSLYTLVHELGHSAHTYLSNAHQNYIDSHYSIFLAEIASTTNENLLTDYLLREYADPAIQAYVLNHFLDGVKGTVYRQTQFAEFEHWMHQQDQAGIPLTADALSEAYQSLNAKYYGSAVNSDSAIRYEWSRIPHFYMNYYVYQYATGFSAATYFAEDILSGREGAVDNYLKFLKAGNSDYPINVMKQSGLDMTQPDYIEATLKLFGERLAEFEQQLDRA